MSEEISNLLIALIPSIVGVLGIVSSVLACISKIRSLTNDSAKQASELREKLKECMVQNAFLSTHYKVMVDELQNLHEDIGFVADKLAEEIDGNNNAMQSLKSQTQEVKDLTSELKRVKAQLKALLKGE